MRRIACLVLAVALQAAAVPVVARGASTAGDAIRRIGTPSSPIHDPVGVPNLAGAPAGFSTVIVTMRSQVDLASEPGAGRAAGRHNLVRVLRAHAVAGQRALLRYLDGEQARGRVVARLSFWAFNGLAVTAAQEVIATIAARDDVASVTSDTTDIVALAKPAPTPTPTPTPAPTATPTPAPTPTPLPDPVGPPEPNIAAVRAPALWSQGITGRGVVVASLDSGVDAGHPDLGPRWRGGSNSWLDPYGQHPSTPVDMTGHGTATMGVIVGGDAGGTTIGMAPGATWIAARIFDDSGSATATAVHLALQWILDPDGDPATDDAPDVVSNSWGYGSIGCNLEFQLDLQAIRAAGILPVFSGGNLGPAPETSTSPANNPEALAVGSVDGADAIDASSSRGPSACGEPSTTYPEVVAPGVDIRTSDRFGLFQVASGTSMAAPHAAGALALLLAAHPGLAVDLQAAALMASAVDLGPVGPDDTYGAGRLDVLAAHDWVTANPLAPPPAVTSLSPTSGPTSGGTTITITGSGFGTTPGSTAVAFGTAQASSVSCPSTTTCTAVSPAGTVGSFDVLVTVDGRTSGTSSGARFSYVAAPSTIAVAVPSLAKGYGYWVTITSAAVGPVGASWTLPSTVQSTLAVYAGRPFDGLPNPVKRSPPAGALATASGREAALSVATVDQPPGTFTVYFYAGASVAASVGTVISLR